MSISREPQDLSKTEWYYEYPTYLLMVHEVRDTNGQYVQTDSFKVPWIMLDRSRRRRPKRHKPKR